MANTCVLPKPTAFLDPLTEVDTCLFYAVPKFYSMDHTNTQWLLNIMRSGNIDKMKRKMELRPDLFRSTYYQLLDDPRLYHCRDPGIHSLFHRQTVLYLTAVGMAMYLRSMNILKLLFEYRDQTGKQLYQIKDPQYATHVQDIVDGDFHSYPVSLVMIRGGFFESAPHLLAAGWNPRESICMPIRRRYERCGLFFHDWLDYTLCLMHIRPLLQISKLVHYMIVDPSIRIYKYLPMKAVRPATDEERIPTGLMDIEDLPVDARLIGTKSLLDIAEDYSLYLRSKEQLGLIKDCIMQMVSKGVNPEIMMAAAQDYDGYEPEPDDPEPEDADGGAQATEAFRTNFVDNSNANNNAATGKKKSSSMDIAASAYVSEPTRILLHANHTDAKPFETTPLRPLLVAVSEYIQSKFYLIYPPIVAKDGEDDDTQAEQMRYTLQKRDAKNAITLLLNLMQLQFNKLDRMNAELREEKQKFKHLDVFKLAHNKRIAITRNIRRISDILFKLLLHSGEFLHFVQASFPPYSHRPDGEVDFAPNPELQIRLRIIQLEAMAEFSKSKTAPAFLDTEGLVKAEKIDQLILNIRVGRQPTQEEIKAWVSQIRKLESGPDSLNASNVHGGNSGNGAVMTGQRLGNNKAASDQSLSKLLAGGAERCLQDVIGQALNTAGNRVTFVKVKRRPRCKRREESEVAAENSEEMGTQIEETETVGELALKLAEQIADLGRSAQGGRDVTQKLVDMYQLILGDLSQIPSVREVLNNAAFAEIEETDLEQSQPPESVGKVQSELNNNETEDFEESTVERLDDKTGRDTRRQFKHGFWGGIRRKACRPVTRCGVRRTRHQTARMFDAPPDGTEFAVDYP